MGDAQFRPCSKCGEAYPPTLEYFVSDHGRISYTCKACQREYNHQWRAEHLEYKREKDRQYDQDHKAEKQEYDRNYRQKYLTHKRDYDRTYYEGHKEQFKAYARARYREDASYRERLREGRMKRAAGKSEYDRQRRVKLREYLRLQSRARKFTRRARERAAPGHFTAHDVQLQIAAQTDKRGRLRCWWCGGIPDGSYHIDHRIPLVRGGWNNPDNLCITCAHCNLSKGARLPQEWIGRLL